MKTILTLSLLLFSILGYSQQHTYTYDATGNRIKREFEIISPPSEPGLRQKYDTTVATSLKAFPNPFNEQVNITLESDIDLKGNERLLLYSENGQLLQEFRMNQKTKTIETQELAKGKYILQLIRDEKSKSFILIKN